LVLLADVCGLLVEAAQADVKVLLVPKIEKLPAPVGEIGMADVNRRDERTVPAGQFAVHRNRHLRLRDQSNNGLLLGRRSTAGESADKDQEDLQLPLRGHLASSLRFRGRDGAAPRRYFFNTSPGNSNTAWVSFPSAFVSHWSDPLHQ